MNQKSLHDKMHWGIIMKKTFPMKVSLAIILLIIVSVLLLVSGYIGELSKEEKEIIVKEGTLTTDETWSGFISIPSSVNVPKGVTLTIKPGTHIYFKSDKGYQEPKKGFLVIGGGRIEAVGLPDERIWFTSDDPDDPINGDWGGISLVDSDGSVFSYVIVEFSMVGIESINSKTTINNSIIRWTNTEGIYGELSELEIENNILYHNCYHEIALENYNKKVTIRGNHFLGGESAIHAEATEAIIEDNYFTGYEGDVVSAHYDSEIIVRNNKFEVIMNPEISPIVAGPGVNLTTEDNDINEGWMEIPPLNLQDFKERDLGYKPGVEGQDQFLWIYPAEDQTRTVLKSVGKGLGFDWSLLYYQGKLYRFSHFLQQGPYPDFVEIDPETGNYTRITNDFMLNPRGLTHDGTGFWTNDFSGRKIFKFVVNGHRIEKIKELPVPIREGGMGGICYFEEKLAIPSMTKMLIINNETGSMEDEIQFSGHIIGSDIVWTGDGFWSANEDIITRFSSEGHYLGLVYPAAHQAIAVAWDGTHLWASHKTCELWDDDKIFELSINNLAVPK
jgi:hypothetical protein